MAQRADHIRHEIADTRAAMTEKLTLLEERVQETVEDVGGIVKDVEGMVKDVKATVHTTLAAVRQGVAGAQSSVEEIVEQVKGTIGETAATVQRTLDLPAQVEQHPWSMFGGALFVGYLLGSWSDSRAAAGPTAVRGIKAARQPGSLPAVPTPIAAAPSKPGLVSDVLEQLQDKIQDEATVLKSAAVGAIMSTLRAMVKQAIPALAPHLEQVWTGARGQHQHPVQPPAATSRSASNGSSAGVRPGEQWQQVQTE